MPSYQDFLAAKLIRTKLDGIRCPKLPKALKPFQRAATEWALSRRASALFAGTGLGKTFKQLSWAQAVGKHEDGPILILTPLAVAQQTVLEAEKFGIAGASVAKSNKTITPITVTNYDRVEEFDPSKFAGVVLDESSIIKHDDSKTRALLTEMFTDVSWKLCCTATPSPNDYVEIGNHAEFLGICSAPEMLATYFVHDGAIRAGEAEEDWRLKRHAEQEFWQWLSTWALVYNSPADLGFDELGYDLPPLIYHLVQVEAQREVPEGQFFADAKMSLNERIRMRGKTVHDRVHAAAALVNSNQKDYWLIWCGRNDEADALEKLISGAQQVSGSMPSSTKENRLLGFVHGTPRNLVTKPSIAGFGMNWQHCHKMAFVGLNDSFEQLYQAIRRCWRFGQEHPVDVHIISSTAEYAVLQNVMRKEAKQTNLYTKMARHSRQALAELGYAGKEPKAKRTSAASFDEKDLPTWFE